jgi:hypothetical protein
VNFARGIAPQHHEPTQLFPPTNVGLGSINHLGEEAARLQRALGHPFRKLNFRGWKLARLKA